MSETTSIAEMCDADLIATCEGFSSLVALGTGLDNDRRKRWSAARAELLRRLAAAPAEPDAGMVVVSRDTLTRVTDWAAQINDRLPWSDWDEIALTEISVVLGEEPT